MYDKKITPEEFRLELLSAVRVCFEGEAAESGNAIVFTAPNGQKCRILTEFIE